MLSESAGSDDRVTLELNRDLNLDDLRAARVDLRKTRLDKVAAETRLARKKGDKAATPLEIAAIEEIVAILTAQEKYLTTVEKDKLETLAKSNGHTMDLETERDEIKLFEETANKIGREVEELGLELDAPKRITILTEAHP